MKALPRSLRIIAVLVSSLLLLSLVPPIDALNPQTPSQGGGSARTSASSARHFFKTTYEFGNANDLLPEMLGPTQKMLSAEQYKIQKQVEQFVDGNWRRTRPEKENQDRIPRRGAIDPCGPSTNDVEPQERVFLDDDEEEEEGGICVDMWIKPSFGDQITKRNYAIDPHTSKSANIRDDTEFKPHTSFKFYAMLGLDKLASQDEIRNAYRRLVKLYHPDSNSEKDTTEQYNLLNRAYEVLTDPILKERYDKYGKKGLGTSAASDKLKAKGKKSFPRRITSTYKMAQSDMGDVKWYGGSPFGTIPLCERTFGSSREGVAGGSSMTIAASKNKGPPRRDLYQLLSLSRKASLEEITQKHKLLSKRYDPEHKENQDCNKECYILYHQVQRAVEVLSDPRLRKRYDMYGFKGLTLEESPSTTEDDVEDPLSVLRKSMKQVANTPPPSPVLAGGVPHSSRISSIQRDRVQPAAETGSEHKEFKAPPAQYRTTLAPIPLENENERFQNLAKSDSVSIKASSRSKQKDEATPLPPTFADLEMTFSSLETVTVKADASNLSKTADAVSRPVQAGGTPRPAVQAGGVPNSSRMTSIQKDRIPQASRTASMDQKAFKAPPAEYRTTLAPIPLANENARFDDLANNDSIPLKAAKKKPQDEAMALPPTTTSTAIASAKSQILFPILDTVNIKRTAETGKQRRNHIAIKRKAGVVSADQDKVIAPRASHKKAKEALHWELDHGRMEISSRMNHQNNIDASHRAPINAGPTISVPGQDKLRPGVKATVKTKAASEDRRTAIHSIPTIGAPVKELDPYQVLSVDTTVDTAELREVYNRLTNEHFADRNKNKTSYILYQTIQQAFKILRDPEKRQAYDMLGMKGVEAILAEKRTVVPPEDKAPELASQVDDVESDSTVPSTVQVEKFPDLPDPDLSKKPKLSLDRDIVATKPSSSDLIQTARKRKNFKAPPTKYRITLAPIPVEEKDERFDALTRSQSVPLKAAIKKKAARPTPSTVGGAGAPNASRTTSIQRERIQPARTTGSEGGKFKAPPAQYRITLAPIPLENENARFDALTRSESVPLKAPSTTSKKQAAKSRQSR